MQKEILARIHEGHFFIFIADEFASKQERSYFLNMGVLSCRDLFPFPSALWSTMSFQYNLVEFCTSLKPFCFRYLFDTGNYDKIIYVDPDVFFYSSPDPIFDDLKNSDIVLTPHILEMLPEQIGKFPDHLLLVNGTFNLGFIGLRKSERTYEFLTWWSEHLTKECFYDNDYGTATDQKWINLLPALLPANSYTISRNYGMNIAPWNFHERKVVETNGKLYVQSRSGSSSQMHELIFAHFSGFDYKGLIERNSINNLECIKSYPDLEPLMIPFVKSLKQSKFIEFRDIPYAYDFYENGFRIMHIHRRFFRRLTAEGEIFKNPFSTDKESFYQMLKSHSLIDNQRDSADKVTNKTITNFGSKLRVINFLFILLRNIVGIRKFTMLIRFLHRYTKYENQIFHLDNNKFKHIW